MFHAEHDAKLLLLGSSGLSVNFWRTMCSTLLRNKKFSCRSPSYLKFLHVQWTIWMMAFMHAHIHDFCKIVKTMMQSLANTWAIGMVAFVYAHNYNLMVSQQKQSTVISIVGFMRPSYNQHLRPSNKTQIAQ